jgi:hypothetical protein
MNKEIIVKTPGGEYVNFIPNLAASIATSVSSTFQPSILYCGVGGDIKVIPSGQTNDVIFAGIQAGAFLPIYINAFISATSADSLLICR